MKLVVELDLTNNTCKVLSKSNLTKKDIASIICDYFSIPFEELTSKPLIRRKYHVLCRWFMTYYLLDICNMNGIQVAQFLNYYDTDTEKQSAIVQKNITKLNKLIEGKEPEIIRIYNNLNKLFNNFSI